MHLSIDKAPERIRKDLAEFQNFNAAVRRVQQEARARVKQVTADMGRTIEWKEPRIAEIREDTANVIAAAHESLRKQLEASADSMERAVEQRRNAEDPLALPKVDPDKLGGREGELARVVIASVERQNHAIRLAVEDKADCLFDRALARDDGSGSALVAVYERALKAGDQLLLSALETSGRARIEAEGKEAQRITFADAIARARDARLPEGAREVLDQAALLRTALMMADVVKSDARAHCFLDHDGQPPGLLAIVTHLGPEIGGVEG